MKKKIVFIICFLLLSSLVLGACAKDSLILPEEHDSADLPLVASPGPAPDNDASIVVMTVNGIDITKDKYNQVYSALCSQYGISEDDPTYKSMFQESAINLLLEEQIIRLKLTELGYMNLSGEDMLNAEAQAQEQLDYVTLNSYESIMASLPEGYTEEDLDAAVKKYEDVVLAQYNITREEFLNYFVEAVALENAKADLLKDAVPTDEEVEIAFQNSVEADKEEIGTDLTVYDSYMSGGQESYYIPAGIRYVRHVLIGFSDEQITNIRTLRQNEDDTAADTARTEALATIQQEADSVLALLQSGGITFTDAITEYGDDPGMETYTEGYEIYEGCTLYMSEFMEGALSLSTVGEITGLVPTDYGYHIIEYTSDRPEGAISFESVRQGIYDNLYSTMQDETWQSLVTEWTSQAEYTVYTEVL